MFKRLALIFIIPYAGVFAMTAEEAMRGGNYQEAIIQYRQAMEQATPGARSDLQLKIAIAHWRDQEQDLSFNAFLSALDGVPQTAPTPLSKEEEALYREALEFYLMHPGREAATAAEQLRQRYTKILDEHPEYTHLGYLVALAFANNGQFDAFFTRFYPCYRADPDHFLAYKTRALLHLRLMARARDPEQRERERHLAQMHVQKALERFSDDVSLYQMNITLARPSEKTSLVQSALGKMTRNPSMVPRSELLFFVKEAATVGEWNLAEQFLAKANLCYPSSRLVSTAEEYLQQRRSRIDKAR